MDTHNSERIDCTVELVGVELSTLDNIKHSTLKEIETHGNYSGDAVQLQD